VGPKATSTHITLYCVVEGENIYDSSFPVKIESSAYIDELKTEIRKCQAPAFNEIASKNLQIFKDHLPIGDLVAELSDQAQKLPGLGTVSEYWDVRPSNGKFVHVVVQKLSATNAQIGNQELSVLRQAKSPSLVQNVFAPGKPGHDGLTKMDVLTEADRPDVRLCLFTLDGAAKPLELTKEQAEFHMMVASLPSS